MNKANGFFVFEGIEGSGKTTLIEGVEDFFRGEKNCVLKTREPGGTDLGKKLREILLNKDPLLPEISSLAELLLFYADRAQHIEEKILPALAASHLVLCDRFIYSTVAYQVYGRGLDSKLVETLNQIVLNKLKPSGVILLDIDPELSFKRVEKRGAFDRFESESLDFHKKIRQGYLDQAKGQPSLFLTLDANQSPTSLKDQAVEFILEVSNA